MNDLANKQPKSAKVCRHLGGPQELDTFYYFSSDLNRCYRGGSANRPSQTHQSEYCLVARHVNCPVFRPEWDGHFPTAIASVAISRRRKRGWSALNSVQKVLMIGVLATVLVIAAVAFLGWRTPLVRIRTQNMVREVLGMEPVDRLAVVATATATPTPDTRAAPPATSTPIPTNSPVPTAVPSETETPLPSETPGPTQTPFPTLGPGFETPFGPGSGFVIHVVAAGESYNAIAQVYGTTAEVLQAVNPIIEGASLWVGRQLVVPIGVSDPGGLPQFEVVLTSAPILLSDLAAQFDADAEALRFFNALGESDLIPSGRWLIIPLPESS